MATLAGTKLYDHQDISQGKNAAMNPLVTPTSQQIRDWLPVLCRDVTSLVYDYVGRPFIATFKVPAGGRIRLPLPRSILVGRLHQSEMDEEQKEDDDPLIYDFEVDWGDGSERCSIFSYNDRNGTHDYADAGLYTVHITGKIPGLCFGIAMRTPGPDGPIFYDYTQNDQLLNISQWGDLKLHSGRRTFEGCRHLTITATDAPNLQHVTDLTGMFYRCLSLTNEDLTKWQIEGVVLLSVMFSGCDNFEGDVSTWSTSKVTDMGGVFQFCPFFNGDLSQWDTSSVTRMISMLNGCSAFTGDLSNWNTSCVTNMSYMLEGCSNFNGDLSGWRTERVTTMGRMFKDCKSFEGDLSRWDTNNVEDMKQMFEGCSSFNGDLSRWGTGAVKNMMQLFEGCSSFNGNLSNWNTAEVVDMSAMFRESLWAPLSRDQRLTGPLAYRRWNTGVMQGNVERPTTRLVS